MLLQHHLESAKDVDLSGHNVARAEAPHTKWSSGTALHVNAVYSEERMAFILSGFLLDHEYLEHEANVGPDLLILHSGDRSEVAGECRYVVRVDSGVPTVVVLDGEDGTRVLRPIKDARLPWPRLQIEHIDKHVRPRGYPSDIIPEGQCGDDVALIVAEVYCLAQLLGANAFGLILALAFAFPLAFPLRIRIVLVGLELSNLTLSRLTRE